MSTPHFRRSAPFTPTAISGCQLWLDGNDTTDTSMTFSSGSNLSTWKDKSGSANHFSLTNGTSSSINDGGYSVVNIPVSGIMSSANQITYTTSSAFFIVSKLKKSTGFCYLLGFTNINGGDRSIRFNNTGYNGILVGTQASTGDSTDLASGNYYVNGNFNPSYDSTYYFNVYSIIDTVAPTSGGTSYLTLSSAFSSRYYNGNIAEVLYYPSGVTGPQQQQIEAYLAQKWGLRSMFSQAHPAITSIIYSSRPSISAIPRTYPSLGISRPDFITQVYPTASIKIGNRPASVAFASTTVIVTNLVISYSTPNYTIVANWNALSGADTYNVTMVDTRNSYIVYTVVTASTTASKVTSLVGGMADGDTIRVSVYGINTSTSTNSLTGTLTALLSSLAT